MRSRKATLKMQQDSHQQLGASQPKSSLQGSDIGRVFIQEEWSLEGQNLMTITQCAAEGGTQKGGRSCFAISVTFC